MKRKLIEIRDEGTCIAVLAVQMVADGPIEERFLYRSGYPRDGRQPSVILLHLSNVEAYSDPYDWIYARTMKAAHLWICDHFDEIENGGVVDVRVMLGESKEPATPEIYTGGPGEEVIDL